MRLMKTRLLSLLLVLALALTLIAPALAEDGSDQADASASVSAQAEEPEQEKQDEEKDEKQTEEKDADESSDTEEKTQEKQEEPDQNAQNEQEKLDEDAQDESVGDESDSVDAQEELTGEPADESPSAADAVEADASAEEAVEAQADAAPAAEAALESDALTLTVGAQAQIRLVGAQASSFQSSDAETVAVDAEGVVTARKVGSALVEVKDQQGKIYVCAVTVEATTTRSEVTMTVGQSAALSLDGRTLARAESSDSAVVLVDGNDQAAALKSGTAELTLTDTLGDLHVCAVRVKAVLNSKALTLSEKKTAKLNFQGSPIVAASSSNAAVASVDEKGKVTANTAGSAVLTLTDASGSEATCKVNVKVNYLARSAASAKKVYGKIVTLHCRHSGGTRSYSQLLKRKKITCGTGVSVALQGAGLLKSGDVITHTTSGSEKRKLSKPSKAIKNLGRLKKGTYTIYKANCKYSKLPAKYKAAGMVYVQASNICISAGDGYIYTTNESSRQYRHGHYFKTRMNKGYTHRHKILFVIAPKS